ncbi:MAG: hypothetical protein ACI8V2_002835 [Candidatus Latescibacterota bacterium]|jgi:hypothetical protein
MQPELIVKGNIIGNGLCGVLQKKHLLPIG